MNELIPLQPQTIDGNAVETVSARTLHEFLGVTERFSSWMERQFQYGFEENVDYLGCKVFNTLAKQEVQEYYLSLDCAKEISMIQKSEKGKQARKYFIECEKQLQAQQSQLPTDPFLLIAHFAQQAYEMQSQVAVIDTRLQAVEAKQEALTDSSNFFSVLAFSNLHDVGLTNQQLSGLSRKAGKMSKLRGEMVGAISDPRWGKVKTYHKDILTELFEFEKLI